LLPALAVLLLAACTITSDRPLTSEDEAATPLPDAFTLFPYEQSANGYVPEAISPMQFTREGSDYVGTDIRDSSEPLRVRFVRLNDKLFLLAATTSDSPAVTYGFARYNDGVLSIALSPDAGTALALQRLRRRMMPQQRLPLAGVTIAPGTDAITVRSRAALDDLGRLYAAGRLPLAPPAVGYVALDPSTTPPSRLVPSAGDWIEVQ
jgi:hypothetical protein